MNNKLDVKKQTTPIVKEVELDILEVEENAFIVKVDGWRMRVYFDKGYENASKKVKVKYTGDIEDVHSIKFEKLR